MPGKKGGREVEEQHWEVSEPSSFLATARLLLERFTAIARGAPTFLPFLTIDSRR